MALDVRYGGRAVHAGTGGAPFDPAVRALVFVHGAQQDHFCWHGMARSFAGRSYSVLAPDLPGHGGSDGPPLTSVETLADWLAGLLDQLGIAGAALVGHSLGSLVALETAARRPDLAGRLALLGTAAPMRVSQGLLAAAMDDPAKAMALINRWSHSPRGSLGGENRASGLWIPTLNLRQMERQPVANLSVDLAACNVYAGAEAAAARVVCPTLVVMGGADRMTPLASARPILDRLADGRSAVIPGAGHALMTEQPDVLRHLLRDFLSN